MNKKSMMPDDYLSLTDVAKVTPGRPSTNCVWRWCRRGVLSRSGERIRLQHVRMGGMIYTTHAWLEKFGHLLAAADTKYFELSEAVTGERTQSLRRKRSPHQSDQNRRQAIEDAKQELSQAGI